MAYYAFIQDNEIIGWGQCPILNDDIMCFEVPEEVYNNRGHYIWSGSDVILDPDYDEKQAQKERERVNNLTMTPLDFISVLQNLGLTLEQINTFLESNLSIKMQLTYCNSVYCGVVKQFLPLEIGGVEITPELVEQAFKHKNGEI